MDRITEQRVQYLFICDGYQGDGGILLPPEYVLRLAPSDLRQFQRIANCSYAGVRSRDLATCLAEAGVTPRVPLTVSPATQEVCHRVVQYSDRAVQFGWTRAAYDAYTRPLRDQLLPPFLLGMLNFYRERLSETAGAAMAETLRQRGFGPALQRYSSTGTEIVSLEPRQCPAEERLVRHELEIPDIPYQIPVLIQRNREGEWENVRHSLIQIFQRLKAFLTPQELYAILHPGFATGTPDFGIVFNDRISPPQPQTEDINRCHSLSYTGGHTNLIMNRIVMKVYPGDRDFEAAFLHEFGHMVLGRLFDSRGMNRVDAWRQWAHSSARGHAREEVGSLQMVTRPDMYSRYEQDGYYCFDSYHEWFAELFSEHVREEVDPPRTALQPHRLGRQAVMRGLFSPNGLDFSALTPRNLALAYSQAGVDHVAASDFDPLNEGVWQRYQHVLTEGLSHFSRR